MHIFILLFLPLLALSLDHLVPPSDPNTPVIELTRHGCYGTCPTHTIMIYADGRVWIGLRNRISAFGMPWATRISTQEVEHLFSLASDSGIFDLDTNRLAFGNIDGARSTLVFNWGSRTMRIRYNHINSHVEDFAREVERCAQVNSAHEAFVIEKEKFDEILGNCNEYINNVPNGSMLIMETFFANSTCSNYTISIRNDGQVSFHSSEGLGAAELQTDLIDARIATAFIDSVAASGFVKSDSTYDLLGVGVPCPPWVSFVLTIGETRREFVTFGPSAPTRLLQFSVEADSLAATSHRLIND